MFVKCIVKNNRIYKLAVLRNKMKIKERLENFARRFSRKAVVGGLVSILSISISTKKANADVVPADFFATDTVKVRKLADYDSVVATSNWDDYYGKIKWDDVSKTDVPIGYRVWMLDKDKKPCGIFNIASSPGIGKYGFLHAYEDDSLTPTIDEGALAGDIMKPYLEEILTGKMYDANFETQVVFHADKGRYNVDILVNPISIPEPATAGLLGAGFLGWLALRKWRIDQNKKNDV